MRQRAITRYFNQKVKTECNETVNVKEEVDLEWDEEDNFYETTFDNINTESPRASVVEKPPNSKTQENIAVKTENTQECPKCKKPFESMQSFKWHVHYCGKESKLQCAHCPYKTKYRKCLAAHTSRLHPKGGDVRSEHKPQLQKYCQKCEKSYEAIRITDCTVCSAKLLLRCPLCKKTFDGRQVARYHWDTRCGVRGYYHCNLCDYKAVFRTSVISHLKKIHHNSQSSEMIQWKRLLGEDETQAHPSYECTKCLKTWSNALSLKSHARKCQGVEKKDKLVTSESASDPNRCSMCKKKFEHIYLLNKHISYCMRNQRVARRTYDSDDEIIEVVDDHPPVSLISADEISKGFKQKAVQYCDKCMVESEFEKKWWKSDLDRKLQCSKCENILVFKCKKCLSEFATRRTVLVHLKYKCYAEDEFKCTKCNFKTTNAFTVRKHYKSVHEGVSSDCEKCGKKFKNLDSLKAHMRLCGVEPKFQCDHCPFKSKLKLYLRNHIIRNHMKPVLISRSESLKIAAQRFARTLIHLEAHCLKCKKKKLLKNRLKVCEKCKTKLNFKCKTCKKKYNVDDENACDHVKAYLETIKFECNRCGRGSVSKNALKGHKNRCKAAFRCRFCKFVSDLKARTLQHEKSKHPHRV